MTRPVLATGAAAVIIALLGAALLLSRGPGSNVGAPSLSPSPSSRATLSPTASPTQIAVGGPLQTQLRQRWIGGNRALPGIVTGAGTSIIFDANTLQLNQSNSDGHPVLTSMASAVANQTIRLESTVAEGGCSAGDVGLYGWSLTADSRTLTITGQSDPCGARMGAVPGTWYLVGCKDPQTSCLGDVAAGTYGSQYIAPRLKSSGVWHPVYGAVTYTVPDGWANSSDWPSTFGLTPSSAYDALPAGSEEGSESVVVVAQAIPMSQKGACSQVADATVARTVDAEITWLRHVPGLVTSAPTAITVNGHPGQWIDLRLSPTWKTACPGGPGPEVDYFLPQSGVGSTAQRQRVIILDLGSGDLAAIIVATDTTAPFAAFTAQAMPIIASFKFQ